MRKIFILLFLCLFTTFSFGQVRFIHVLVALCDNEHQGIVKVPAKIGNGKDPFNNLYWGCAYGVKTYFKNQSDWKMVKSIAKPSSEVLERVIFKHASADVYLVADAYDGELIKNTTIDFFKFSAGLEKKSIMVDSVRIGIGGNADLICYVGHDGLMEFSLEKISKKSDEKKREAIILACASKDFFGSYLKQTGAYPLLWTSNLMAPEAYTLYAAVAAWIKKQSPEEVREQAAQAYNKYQKCGINGARRLLVTGW
ncbi:MAG: hypothetical protein ACK4ND_15460 [Cytophagaceae bacterium]